MFISMCTGIKLDPPGGDKEWLLNFFLNPPSALHKVYLFNLTNPTGFLKSEEKPAFAQLGPYAYNEKWTRDDQKLVSDDRIEFTPKRIFRFNPRKSQGNRQTDRLTNVNVPMLTALHQMKYGPPVLRKSLNTLLDILQQESFPNFFVRDLLWGMKSDLTKLGRDIGFGPVSKYPYDKFGLYLGINGTDNGKMTVNIGPMGKGILPAVDIVSKRGKSEFGVWQKGSDCDTVRGSDGVLFDPKEVAKKTRLHVNNPDFCQSLPYDFEREVERQGIKAFRFTLSKDAYGLPRNVPDNACFCVDQSCRGVRAGLRNVTACNYGTPLMISNPHFLNGDESLRLEIGGMKPDLRLHQSFFEIEPTTGLTLKAKVAIQVNAAMQSMEGVRLAKGFQDLIIPLLYFTIQRDHLNNQSDVDTLKSILAKRNL